MTPPSTPPSRAPALAAAPLCAASWLARSSVRKSAVGSEWAPEGCTAETSTPAPPTPAHPPNAEPRRKRLQPRSHAACNGCAALQHVWGSTLAVWVQRLVLGMEHVCECAIPARCVKHFVCLVRAIISTATASLLSPWMGNGAYRVFLRLALGTPRLSIVTGTFSCGRERPDIQGCNMQRCNDAARRRLLLRQRTAGHIGRSQAVVPTKPTHPRWAHTAGCLGAHGRTAVLGARGEGGARSGLIHAKRAAPLRRITSCHTRWRARRAHACWHSAAAAFVLRPPGGGLGTAAWG
jgi:hypothetical protein